MNSKSSLQDRLHILAGAKKPCPNIWHTAPPQALADNCPWCDDTGQVYVLPDVVRVPNHVMGCPNYGAPWVPHHYPNETCPAFKASKDVEAWWKALCSLTPGKAVVLSVDSPIRYQVVELVKAHLEAQGINLEEKGK